MLTRVLFALALICGMAAAVAAEDAKVLALGITDHEVTQEEIEKGEALTAPHFNTPAIAYVLAADLKKGDIVEIALVNEDRSLLHNTQTLARGPGEVSAASGKARRAGRRLAGRQLSRQGQDHPRRQDADRAELETDRVRVGLGNGLPLPTWNSTGGHGAFAPLPTLRIQAQGRRAREAVSKFSMCSAFSSVRPISSRPSIRQRLRNGIDVEMDHAAVGTPDLLVREIDGDGGVRAARGIVEQLVDLALAAA